MKLGEKLRQARLEAGLSQRGLCEGIVSRNMLSQIEHGTANPSMATMAALAARLGKPVDFFLEHTWEQTDREALLTARKCLAEGDTAAAWQELARYEGTDVLLEGEHARLVSEACLALAEEALAQSREGLAGSWLAKAAQVEEKSGCRDYLRAKRLLLQGKLDPAAWQALPPLDTILLAKAEGALQSGEFQRCRRLLEAMEGRTGRWYLLMGKCALEAQAWQQGAELLAQAEQAYPVETAPLLELAYRQLGDFRRAYEYACLQRKG